LNRRGELCCVPQSLNHERTQIPRGFAFHDRFLKNTILTFEIAIVSRKKRSQFCISQSFSEKHDLVFKNCDRFPENTIIRFK